MSERTDTLIGRLADGLEPIRPLPSPWTRTALWLVLSGPYLAIVLFALSPRHDLLGELSRTRFAVEQVAALATGVAAAFVAFSTVVPGASRGVLLLPLLPLAVWLGSVGHMCVQDWIVRGPASFAIGINWACIQAILTGGLLPAAVIAFMLRAGAPLTPHLTMALGGLAAAGLGNFAVRFIHAQDASVVVLVWHLGTVALVAAAIGGVGRLVLNWRSLVRPAATKIS